MDVQNIISTAARLICAGLDFTIGLYFYRVLCCTAQKRPGALWTAVIYCSCVALSNMVIFSQDMFNITMDLIWLAALLLLCFRGKVSMKLGVTAIVYPLIVAQNFLVLDMLGKLYVISGRLFAVDIAVTFLDKLIHLAAWYCIYRFFKARIKHAGELFDDRTWYMLCTVCFASMVSIITCIYFSPDDSWKIWPAAIAAVTTNIGSLYLAEYFMDSIKRSAQQENLKLQKEYYEELEKNQNEIRRLRHDMNNHLGIISDLFRSGKQEEAQRYLQDIGTQIAVTNRVFCRDSIINAVLNSKYNLALEHQIDCFFNIELEHILGIDAVSLCSLLSNTLDNAIEACQKVPQPENRRISVKARGTGEGYFSYEITNSKVNEIHEKKGRFLSDKGGPKSHGIGLSNVRRTVERYQGMLDISYTEDTFTVVILISGVV